MVFCLLWWIGLFTILGIIGKIILSKLRNKTKIDEFKYGWAAITGATSGIGREYAEQLAGGGFNIILISRDEGRLIEVKQELAEKYSVQVEYVRADFKDAREDPEEYFTDLMKKLEDYEVSVLVNNAGILNGPDYRENIPL